MIAGAMSKAYDEIVTISLVSFDIRQEYFKFKTCPPVVTLDQWGMILAGSLERTV